MPPQETNNELVDDLLMGTSAQPKGELPPTLELEQIQKTIKELEQIQSDYKFLDDLNFGGRLGYDFTSSHLEEKPKTTWTKLVNTVKSFFGST